MCATGMQSLRKCCTQLFGAHPKYAHKTKDMQKQICTFFLNKATTQTGTSVWVRAFNARLLAKSQFAYGRSCDRQTPSRFSVVSLRPRANAELAPKFHVPLHASHATSLCYIAALPIWYKYSLMSYYVYQRDERALPGFLPSPTCSANHYHPTFFYTISKC
jgi:hypothetical protein